MTSSQRIREIAAAISHLRDEVAALNDPGMAVIEMYLDDAVRAALFNARIREQHERGPDQRSDAERGYPGNPGGACEERR